MCINDINILVIFSAIEIIYQIDGYDIASRCYFYEKIISEVSILWVSIHYSCNSICVNVGTILDCNFYKQALLRILVPNPSGKSVVDRI